MSANKVEWYLEFVDLDYKPAKDDLKVLFYFEPSKGISPKEAAGRIASESSTGTWTTLFTMPKRMQALEAKVFEIQGNYCKVAYPLDLWEKGNAPQLLSGIAGNIYGMKALENLRLVDASFPKEYLKGFKGPNLGIKGLRKYFGVKKRPLTGAVPKPKIGFSAKEHARIGYETWVGGFDLVKDDENLTSTSFNKFEERVKLMTKLREKAEKETGSVKDALLNITAPVKIMQKRAKLLHENGWKYAMIDVVTTGTSAVQEMREVLGDYKMAIHAHRAMHAAFDKNPKHGITMQFLAKLHRIIGVDQIHAGTAVGKLVGDRHEVHNTAEVLRDRKVKAVKGHLLEQDWQGIKPVFPVSSGGLHPGLVPEVMRILGNETVILVSGGIHGHPKGTRAGAKAAMQAIEAEMQGESLTEKAKSSVELRQALEKWGRMKPV
nr:RuBisCO long chain, Form III-b [uncultured archaeon]